MEQICKNCKHYHDHYAKVAGNFVLIPDGHCVSRRSKLKRADAKACEDFQARQETVSTEIT